MILVDTNIFSEPTRPRPNAAVLAWIEANADDLVVSPIVLGELYEGILSLPAGKRKNDLVAWFQILTREFSGSILPVDQQVGLRWAELLADLKRQGKKKSLEDTLIAATALVHDLTIATRNTDDFKHTGCRLFNPFDPRK
jgi:predicted nucleic acid-binding protein